VSVWVGLFLTGLGLAMGGQDLQSAEHIEARVLALSAQLSCVACETATTADPNGALGVELRRELRVLVQKGRSDSEVVEALIARYGDFVRYRPPADDDEPWVWAFMLLASLISAAVVIRLIQRDRPVSLVASSSVEENLR
jgi:cytochrome c-type biogenesis protein CcmH